MKDKTREKRREYEVSPLDGEHGHGASIMRQSAAWHHRTADVLCNVHQHTIARMYEDTKV